MQCRSDLCDLWNIEISSQPEVEIQQSAKLTHVSFAWSPDVPDVDVVSTVPRRKSSTEADADFGAFINLMTPSFQKNTQQKMAC